MEQIIASMYSILGTLGSDFLMRVRSASGVSGRLAGRRGHLSIRHSFLPHLKQLPSLRRRSISSQFTHLARLPTSCLFCSSTALLILVGSQSIAYEEGEGLWPEEGLFPYE